MVVRSLHGCQFKEAGSGLEAPFRVMAGFSILYLTAAATAASTRTSAL